MQQRCGWLIIVLVSALLCVPAKATSKVALVIGNSAYRSVPMLRNPANDADDVAVSFERLGFVVTRVKDAAYDEMRQALLSFSRTARGAEMAVVFYAGHGIEVSGENWLIPVDAELRGDTDVDYETVSLRGVMVLVESASKLGLVILDACRNNPFATKMRRTGRVRAVPRGLAQVEPTGNVLVAYAAKDGTLAADGAGRNSPFTGALLNHIETPGLEINFLFRNVRDEVIRATNRQQHPFVYGSLSREEIYLMPSPAAPALGATTPGASSPDHVAWTFLKDSKHPDAIKRFIEQFPNSALRVQAEARLAALSSQQKTPSPAPQGPEFELAYWDSIKTSSSISAFESYLKAYPNGAFSPLAKLRIEELKRDSYRPVETPAPHRQRNDGKKIKNAKRAPATRAMPAPDVAPSSRKASMYGHTDILPGGPRGSLRGTGIGRRCRSGDSSACELLRARCAAGGRRACGWVSGSGR
jgi:hypothetical protein